MAEGLQKLVPFFSEPGKKKKRQNENKKKNIEFVDKEVWNITGGFFPLIPTNNDKPREEKAREWIYGGIVQKSQNVSSVCHWMPLQEKDKVFDCEKYNVPIELIMFTQQEFQDHLKDLDISWSFEETQYLWELCERYDLRFIIIADRYDEKYCRGIEDLKQRFYSVTKRLLQIKGEQTHPLYNYKYDPEYERVRKFELEKFLMRAKDTSETEKIFIEQLRKVEVHIKKEEKENLTLQKALKDLMNEDNELDIGEDNDCIKIIQTVHESNKKEISNPTESICYLRGKWLNEPLPISEKMNKKLNLVLNELCIPNDFIATEENENTFEELREQIFSMFNFQKSLKKKENLKKIMEEKKRKLLEDISIAQTNPEVLAKRANPFVGDNMYLEKVLKKVKQ